MNVLISGAGIAGPTLAFWLRKYGFAPTLVETAPALQTRGYVIDFRGLGYDIAGKMGLLPDIASAEPWPARRDTQKPASPSSATRPCHQTSIWI